MISALCVKYPSERQAGIAKQTLEVDDELHEERASKTFELKGCDMHVYDHFQLQHTWSLIHLRSVLQNLLRRGCPNPESCGVIVLRLRHPRGKNLARVR